VGVVEDVRMLRGGGRGFSLDRESNLYFSARQARGLNYGILARAPDRPGAEALHHVIAGVVRNEDPTITVYGSTLAETIDSHLFVTRVFGWMLGALAATALLLSVIGVYGLVAYGVSQRTREIGVRLALGGTTPVIVRMIVREGLRFVGIGLAVGLLLSAGATRLLSILLYGVSAMDAATYAAAAALFGVVALVACWLPARRAARVDPIVALRSE
jgi:predicted lysophospholipase L1 biosynthesis ABC-type transport system permease subunit